MALQIRRGLNSQRLALDNVDTPAGGELLYTTDSKKLYIGDGTTAGGAGAGYFGAVQVSGQDTLYSTGDNEALTVEAGTNILLTTNDGSNTLTINTTGTITANLTGNVTGNVSGNAGTVTNGVYTSSSYADPTWITSLSGSKISGAVSSASSVTNGVYTTDTGTVTNTMLAGNIDNSKLANSSITINGSSVSLGGTISVSAAAGSLAGTTLASNVVSSSLTSVGTLGSLSVTGGVTAGSFTGNVTGNVTGDVTGTLTTDKIKIYDQRITTTISNVDLVLDPSGTGKVLTNAYIQSARLELLDPTKSGITIANQVDTHNTLLVSTAHNNASTSQTFTPAAQSGPQTGSTLVFLRARGTVLAPADVQNGDEISTFDYVAKATAGVSSAAKIKAVVDGVPTASAVPGRFEFLTNDTSGSNAVRLTVSSSAVSSNVPVNLPVYADATARDAAVTSPAAGMMIFLTSTSKFQGYTGSTWADLN